MRKIAVVIILALICTAFGVGLAPAKGKASPPKELPVKNMVTMIDLGADRCIPCKMMAPILAELKKEYEGKAAIVFLDVWKDKSLVDKYGISAIPTQIFYNQAGKEILRHQGFWGKEDIILVLNKLGVKRPQK